MCDEIVQDTRLGINIFKHWFNDVKRIDSQSLKNSISAITNIHGEYKHPCIAYDIVKHGIWEGILLIL